MSANGSIECRLCGSDARFQFFKPLAFGYVGRYYECISCELLQSTHLDKSDAQERAELYAKSDATMDPGAAWRQVCVVNRVKTLRTARAIRWPARVLDYGGGSGFVSSALTLALSCEAWTYEPYALTHYGDGRVCREWSDVVERGPYDLIIASEVLEHLTEPKVALKTIADVLSDDGWIYITTGLYQPGTCKEDWPYLAPSSGQHVCFYSSKAMAEVSKILGANFYSQVGAEYEWMIGRRVARGSLAPTVIRAIRTAVGLGLLSKIE